MSDVDVDIPAQGAPIPIGQPTRRRWWRRDSHTRLNRRRVRQARRWRRQHGARPPKPRLRKLRLLAIVLGLGTIAFISSVFGMLMAVASDLPQIENAAQYRAAVNSYLYDDQGKPIGIFAAPDHAVIDTWQQISPSIVHAIIAVEDKRFWTDPGVDIRGLARAFIADITGGQTQGGSTIAEQFVKNALNAENNRTIFEKLREAALAYHLTREWKKTKILTQYLNTIYFGNGAYGIESAARVYFGTAHGYSANAGPSQPLGACGDANVLDRTRPSCASKLRPYESALLAGMVANPTEFNPFDPATRAAAKGRRNLVLLDMFQQHYITRGQYEYGKNQPLPTAADLQQPAEPPAAPYFTSWLRPQIISAVQHVYHVPPSVAEYRAFYGGLKIRTTIDLSLQQAAQQAIDAEFPPGSAGPTAALVAIDNQTGEVRAMVSGASGEWSQSQFNLATQGHRQPGSSFKVFTLAEALRTGEYGPDSIIDSAPQNFIVPNSAGKEHFIVHNFGNTYSGPITLAEATAISDNSVFSQVGIHVGTLRIARLATKMGIRSIVSHNYAMILGGLKIGVSPLDMAHAYETLATGGLKVFNPNLGDMQASRGNAEENAGPGPTGIQSITCDSRVCGGRSVFRDHPTYQRILPAATVAVEHQMLEAVVGAGGTAPMAAIPGVVVAGKTGTTSNYGDAWFVGWTPQLTAAVWVGYPNRLVPMTTTYNGAPVEGGTYPAIIWHNFMVQALQILANEQAAKHHGQGATGASGASGATGLIPSTGSTAGNTGGAASPGATGNSGAGNGGAGKTGNTGTGNSGAGKTGNSGGGQTGNTGGGHTGNTGGGQTGNSGSGGAGSGGAGIGGGGG